MPRLDIATSDWHKLVKPVIPHVASDRDAPDLAVIRVELDRWALYGIATDRYTLAAERHQLTPVNRGHGQPEPVHVKLSDAKASLALFGYSKDADPPLQVTIDTVAVPVVAVGRSTTIRRLAITLETGDGTRLVMHDQRDPSADPLASWRDRLRIPLQRTTPAMAPALNLSATQLARWSAACRGAERLAVFTGARGDELVLVAVEDHFLAVWKPMSYLESPAAMLAASPWHAELVGQVDERPGRFDKVYGLAGAITGHTEVEQPDELGTTSMFQQPAKPEPEHELGPWITATYVGKCEGCESVIDEGDTIRADGQGGWLCGECGDTDSEAKDGE